MITPESGILQPVQKKDRINSLDVIRGIALLGILLMNIHGMGLPFAYGNPTVAGGSEGLNLYVWIMNEMLFEGTMRGLFTLLFGAGVILLTERLETRGAGIKTADIYYRRLLWLLLFGIIHAYVLLWDGEILYPYALFGLMLFPFRNTKPKQLIIFGLCLLSIGILWSIGDRVEDLKVQKEGIEAIAIEKQGDSLTDVQQTAFDKWEDLQKTKTPEEIQERIEDMNQGYFGVMKAKIRENQFMQTWVTYRYWPWDLMSFMLIGMAFFKLRIFHGEKSFKFYAILMAIGYLVGLTLNYFETKTILDGGFNVMSFSEAGITYEIGRIFTTLGHVGLFMLFIKSGILGFLQSALAAVGKMALTNYLMHSIIAAFVFFGFGFGLYGQLERYELYYVVFSIWIFQLIVSPIWLHYFRFGPAEWLWRSLTYKKKQPFKL
ncbi:DUF418 domain-containing protein [Winogradskyella sp. A3E31]|uniref:DUF418 domain-containing protein n=1 Tax=Winogradskyella sp. A3E31 TaxID=3349637 RepID=UPI00398B734D